MSFLTNIWFILGLTAILLGGTIYLAFDKHEVPDRPATVEHVNVDGATVAALWNTQTGYIEQLTFELRDREAKLDDRAKQLKEIEERVHNEQIELQKFQKDLADLQKKLDETILTIENEEVKNLRDMATKYSNIDPEELIKVFDVMDDVEVVKVLYFMEPDAQSDIFSAMIAAGDGDNAGMLADKLTGPRRVAKLNEMLKFTIPPQKKKGEGLF